MKFISTHFVKNQALQAAEMNEVELSSAELETVCGGGSCPGSNGFSYAGNPYPSVGSSCDGNLCQNTGYPCAGNSYQGAGNSYQGAGYNYGGFPNTAYASGCNQSAPCMIPPSACSSY